MEISFYTLFVLSFYLLLWGAVINNTGNFISLIVVKIVPAALGIWGLWECAIIYLSNN